MIETVHSRDPKEHAQNIEKHISDLKAHCLEDIERVDEPKAKALFATIADVLDGVEKALSDYQSENESAWINDPDRPSLQ
jgi:hypothetical protein